MSRHLPSLQPREVLRAPTRVGFSIHHVPGGQRVTLPWRGKDLKRKTLTTIIDQAGLTVEEFLKLV